MNPNRILFVEKQRVSPASWLFSLVGVGATPVGLTPMTTTITPQFLNVHRGPRRHETWRVEDLATCEATEAGPSRYRRRGPGSSNPNEPVYSLGGTHRVRMTLTNGKSFVLGTRRPQELCAAVHQARAEGAVYRETLLGKAKPGPS